jgi:hypothetical protein
MATKPKHVGVKKYEVYIYIYNVQLCFCWCQRNFKVNLLLVWNENCALLVQYAKYTGDSLPTFRDKNRLLLQGKISRHLKIGPINCPETSVKVNTLHCVISQKTAVLMYLIAEM